jgi:hypothetical protein
VRDVLFETAGTRADRETCRRLRDRVEAIEGFGGADPEEPGPILENELEKAPARIVRVDRIAVVGPEFVAVVAVQVRRGVEPHEPLIVLKDVADVARR